jgi:hypothetical protein
VILGVTGPVLGLAGLFTVTANNGPVGAAINALVAAQGLWVIATAATLALRRPDAGRFDHTQRVRGLPRDCPRA